MEKIAYTYGEIILLEPLMELKFNNPEIVMMSVLAGDMYSMAIFKSLYY